VDDLQSALRHPGLTADPAVRRHCQELALAAIQDFTRTIAPEEAIVKWARDLLTKTNQIAPPCDLRRVAVKLNAKIDYVPLSSCGRLLYEYHGSQILVNRDRRSDEQRFSIAHECGHILLRNIIVKRIRDPEVRRSVFRWGNSDEQERLCNRLAAELLMPEDWVRDALTKSNKRGVELVCDLASEFRVSLTMVIRRLVELGLPYLAVWYLSDEHRQDHRGSGAQKLHIKFGWSYKPAGFTTAYIPKAQSITHETLVYRVYAGRKRDSAWEIMTYAGLHDHPHFAEAVPTKTGVLLLVDLERQPEASTL
jgi:Zn-dependent peptidase ImmA (M78 family)